MKKNIPTWLWRFALAPSLAARAFAVWPPSTSLEERADRPARRDLPVLERFEEDVRRLESVLRDLKEDQQELKRRGGASESSAPSAPSKKNGEPR